MFKTIKNAALAIPIAVAAYATPAAGASVIDVDQAQPVYRFPQTTPARVDLFQDKTLTQSGITITEAEDKSFAGLPQEIYELTDVNGDKLNQSDPDTGVPWTFADFLNERNFSYTILGDSHSDGYVTGWGATPNADYSEIVLAPAGRGAETWSLSAEPTMNTRFSFDFSAIDRNGNGAYDPGIEGIVIGPDSVQNGFVGYTEDIFNPQVTSDPGFPIWRWASLQRPARLPCKIRPFRTGNPRIRTQPNG